MVHVLVEFETDPPVVLKYHLSCVLWGFSLSRIFFFVIRMAKTDIIMEGDEDDDHQVYQSFHLFLTSQSSSVLLPVFVLKVHFSSDFDSSSSSVSIISLPLLKFDFSSR